jgi:hypothetical protein
MSRYKKKNSFASSSCPNVFCPPLTEKYLLIVRRNHWAYTVSKKKKK